MKILAHIFAMLKKPTGAGRTHDYTNRYWGHDYCINDVVDKGQKLEMMGWGGGIDEGDFIILPYERGTTRYQVEEIEYYSDPPDMWRLTAVFAPRARSAATEGEELPE